MIKTCVVVGIFVASFATAAPSSAQHRSSPPTSSAAQQADPVRRAWIGRAVSHILADDDGGHAGAR